MRPADSSSHSANRIAFEILVRQHQRALMAYAHSLLVSIGRVGDYTGAEDLLQDSLVVAFENLHRFDHSRSFPAWVRGIMRFRHLKNARAVSKTISPQLLDALDVAHEELLPNLDQDGIDSELMVRLKSCLDKLSLPVQQAIELFYLRRMTVAAISENCGDATATIKKRLQRGRDALYACLKQGGGYV